MSPVATSDPAPATAGSPRGRRARLFAGAGAVASIDLIAKAWAQRAIPPVGIEAGPVDLRLSYNSGIAFSLGAEGPTGLLIAVTALITAVVAVIAWGAVGESSGTGLFALGLLLGGAVANLVDRTGDGVVTDYLHTGWWPTFNLADTAIVAGALLLAVTSWRRDLSDDPPPSNGSTEMEDAASAVASLRHFRGWGANRRASRDWRDGGDEPTRRGRCAAGARTARSHLRCRATTSHLQRL